ncbi:MAG: calcium-binding protein, partial [Candidatus Paceibacterota bacterium]
MAIKFFNGTETEYNGTAGSDLIVGNDLGNFIDGGEGNDVIVGGTGDDTLLGGGGNDFISGGAGNDTIDVGSGNNFADGGAGDDSIFGGDGNDVLSGGDGNDAIFAGAGDDVLTGGNGNDFISGGASSFGNESVAGNVFIVTSDDVLLGDTGNDTYIVSSEDDSTGVIIQAGVSGLDNSGNGARYVNKVEAEEGNEDAGFEVFDTVTGLLVPLDDDIAEEVETDVRLNFVTRPGSSAISTFATTIAGYNAVDTLEFTESGEFEGVAFSGIERIELSSGVSITLEAEQLEENGESLALGEINPGTHIYGVAGGEVENVTLELEFEEEEFEPASSIVGATPVSYDKAVFEVDDFSVAHLYHNVDVTYDASEGVAGSFTRIDGANEGSDAHEIVLGSEGVDYATMRLGDDTVYGNGGNDLLIGHGGA